MDIFSVLTLIGGLAFFLYGMHILSAGLEKVAGNRLKKTLESVTSSTGRAVLVGAGITTAIQSSSAVTVMLVGLVNSGLMTLSQSVGLIMGSNVGTTITAWILSLAGIDSNSVFVNLLKPTSFSPVLAFIGIGLLMLSKKAKHKNIGEVLLGFAVLMFGMELMSGAVKPLADVPGFVNMLTYFKNPILGVLAGALLTALIQSSSASVGILQALSMTGGITFGAAVPIIMGQNIGTCVTSIISSIGASKNARRVAAVHVLFNVIGTVIFLILIYGVNLLFPLAILQETVTPLGVAVAHSIFNIASTALLIPFRNGLEKLAVLVVRDNKKSKSDFDLIDERLLATPSIAVAECKNVTSQMFDTALEQIELAVAVLAKYDPELDQKINENEDRIDLFEDRLGTYLIKLNADLVDSDRQKVAQMLRAIGDLERISDHAVNLLEAAQELHEKGTSFSQYAMDDLKVISCAILEILGMAHEAFVHNDLQVARDVESLEEIVDELKDAIMARHIERLQRGMCTIELGFVISNVLTNYERISDHCSNLAIGVVIVNGPEIQMDYHGYQQELRIGNRDNFENRLEDFRGRFRLGAVDYGQDSESAPQAD